MEIVEPIRSEKQLRGMSNYLKGKNLRDYTLFIMGINSALRISDLLGIKVAEVYEKDRIAMRERKTGKVKDFPLAPICRKAVKIYVDTYQLHQDNFLFPSRKGGYTRPIQRVQAWKIINDAARSVGIEGHIGTHTLRKTFGYHAFKQGRGIELIQKLLNHSSPAITLAYIGITKDDMDEVYLTLNLGF